MTGAFVQGCRIGMSVTPTVDVMIGRTKKNVWFALAITFVMSFAALVFFAPRYLESAAADDEKWTSAYMGRPLRELQSELANRGIKLEGVSGTDRLREFSRGDDTTNLTARSFVTRRYGFQDTAAWIQIVVVAEKSDNEWIIISVANDIFYDGL
jgi:hypothetical protein